jgi:hypothetical protein
MLTYEQISDDWFYLLMPAGETFDEFEASAAREDRSRTTVLLNSMRDELPRTFRNIFGIETFEFSLDILRRIDEALTVGEITSWISESNPDDANNFFKLTLSEIAVYYGELLIRTYEGGSWRPARFPNFFQSSVSLDGVLIYVFDTVMKRCSRDYHHETLLSKWETFHSVLQTAGSTKMIS